MQSTTLRRGGKTKPFVSSLRFAIARRSSGWPRIAMVISVDLPIVGRRRPGDTLRFCRGYGRDGRGALPGLPSAGSQNGDPVGDATTYKSF